MQTCGLIVYVSVMAISVAALLYDWWLKANDLQTITDRVYATPLLGVPILLFQVAGLIGLGLHFYYRS